MDRENCMNLLNLLHIVHYNCHIGHFYDAVAEELASNIDPELFGDE